MSLVRAAFECEDGVIQLVVLCAGCLAELNGRINTRCWSRYLETGSCEFCEGEIRDAAKG